MKLSSNFFDGGWPRSLGNLSYSTYLDLHDNKFTREIPQNLGNLAQLEHLDVLRNMLCGKIPEKICSLFNLFYLKVWQKVDWKGWCRKVVFAKTSQKFHFLGTKVLWENCGFRLSGQNL